MDKIFQIFRAGTHTDMSGRVRTYSETELNNLATSYNATTGTTPLCIGHPVSNFPAYGRVKSLFVKAGKLYAVGDVWPALLSMVKEGRYKNVSASFTMTAGVLTGLNHVGFLGAWAPGVRGMDPLEFAEFGEPCPLPGCPPQHQAGAFAVPAGYTADPSGLKLLALVHEFATACPELTFSEAVTLASNSLNT